MFIVFVFWHSIWGGAPRADQLSYLHQVGQYSTLPDILLHAPSWNRTHSATGDSPLYRPVLYVLLGLEYFFFGYNFALWQLLAIALHTLVALSLLSILWKTRIQGTTWPLAITCLFAGSFLGSELVIWNHLTGYLLFCLLIAQSLNALLSFVGSMKIGQLLVALVCSEIAMFTYEFGTVYSILAGGTLLWSHRTSVKTRDARQRHGILRAAILMLLVPLPYVFLSMQGMGTTLPTAAAFNSAAISHAGTYTQIQLVSWMLGLLAPAAFKVVPHSRAFVAELSFGKTSLDLANCAALVLLGAGLTALIISVRRRRLVESILRVMPILAFLVLYSGIVAAGRSLEKGIGYTLRESLYYAYIPAFAVCLGLAFAIGNATSRQNEAVGKHPVARRAGLFLLRVSLIALVGLNAWSTYHLCRAYRIGYSSMRLGIISRVLEWRKGPGESTGAFFQVGPECVDNLQWFTPHVRKGRRWTGPFLMPDVLFPEKSLILNQQEPAMGNAKITSIPCPVSNLRDISVLEGLWEIGPVSPYCRVRVMSGHALFEDDIGNVSPALIDQGTIVIADWEVSGRASFTPDSQTIQWSNGTMWYRARPSGFSDALLLGTEETVRIKDR